MPGETTLTRAYEANQRGEAFARPFDTLDPTGADDVPFYLKNDNDRALVLYRIRAITTVTGTLEVASATGVAAGTDTTTDAPISLNAGSQGGGGFTVKTGVDITGLTLTKIDHIELLQAIQSQNFVWEEGIWIPSGAAAALNWEAATGILSGSVYFYREGNGRTGK